ncbi:MAG: VCBS repeat-containing protein [Marivita sp.]|uniref:FG-GAP repeat domain-containing protein n=1 Tax=Marivita sp. TaxID=2003365 RepID=UPI001B170D4C|nr:VCBS repeat-containing protein [Marivita sp.]MBO6883910.1 VCBS repeat-containing protein [Marivita sp.]
MRLAGVVALVMGLASPAMAQEIVSARYDGPTTRYPHGVLGDDIEYDTLVVRLSDGREISARWAQHIVFEDLSPRVVDVDGDGAPEVVVVESHETQGARLAIWGMRDGALAQISATPHIGTRFRWLAPVAVADLDGDGRVELAYVDRPHLAKVLRVWRYRADGDLTQVASVEGLTNHRIGWDYIAGGLRNCGQGPEMVLADAGWANVVAVRLADGALTQQVLGAYSPVALERAFGC